MEEVKRCRRRYDEDDFIARIPIQFCIVGSVCGAYFAFYGRRFTNSMNELIIYAWERVHE